MWPENVAPFTVFRAMATQWSVGMNGPIGLRMEALAFVLEVQEVPRADWPEVTEAVQVLERETLRLWRKQSGA